VHSAKSNMKKTAKEEEHNAHKYAHEVRASKNELQPLEEAIKKGEVVSPDGNTKKNSSRTKTLCGLVQRTEKTTRISSGLSRIPVRSCQLQQAWQAGHC